MLCQPCRSHSAGIREAWHREDCACSAGPAVVRHGAGIRDGGKSEGAAGFGQGLSTLVMLTSKTHENQGQCI